MNCKTLRSRSVATTSPVHRALSELRLRFGGTGPVFAVKDNVKHSFTTARRRRDCSVCDSMTFATPVELGWRKEICRSARSAGYSATSPTTTYHYVNLDDETAARAPPSLTVETNRRELRGKSSMRRRKKIEELEIVYKPARQPELKQGSDALLRHTSARNCGRR